MAGGCRAAAQGAAAAGCRKPLRRLGDILGTTCLVGTALSLPARAREARGCSPAMVPALLADSIPVRAERYHLWCTLRQIRRILSAT
jgi:hypothetical protein